MVRCLELTKRLLNHPAGIFFREPVDPVRHECPNYFDVIKVCLDREMQMCGCVWLGDWWVY